MDDLLLISDIYRMKPLNLHLLLFQPLQGLNLPEPCTLIRIFSKIICLFNKKFVKYLLFKLQFPIFDTNTLASIKSCECKVKNTFAHVCKICMYAKFAHVGKVCPCESSLSLPVYAC